MKPRRRTILKVIALLAAGAALNVAVAWGLTSWPVGVDWTSSVDVPPKDIEELAQIVPPRWWVIHRDVNSRIQGWGVDFDSVALSFRTDKPSQQRAIRLRAGWPSRCIEWSAFGGNAADGPPYAFNDSIRVNKKRLPTGVLPLRFAVNTVFYAGVLWMLFCGPFALRRMIRRRRGQCAQCAYPIGQSPICTECGAAVTPKVVQE